MPQRNTVTLKVQPLSGHDKSHYHDLTTNVGTITPVLTDELIPGSIANLNVAASVSLPPLASDSFAKIDLKLEAFAVPLRILYGGFEKWFTDTYITALDYEGPSIFQPRPRIPKVVIGSNFDSLPSIFGICTLTDYLGNKIGKDYYSGAEFNILPYLAYHKIYDDWYRSPLVQQQLFSDSIFVTNYESNWSGVANFPHLTVDENSESFLYDGSSENEWMYFCNSSTVFSLHQRNYGYDYFTNAWPSLQFGQAMSVAPGQDGTITIAAIRASNSLQLFEEKNNFSPRFYQALKARYGVSVNAGVVQRPVFLGSATIPVKTYGVDVSANNGDSVNSNPFAGNAGAQLGRARGEGFVNLIDSFHVVEPSYIIVLATVVPRAVYSSGVNRMFDRYIREGGIAEMANPTLQNTGNEAIYPWELNGRLSQGHSVAFGYTDRYASWMTMQDRISGQLREGGNLASFVLKRNFEDSATPFISSSFLQIPATALDEISAYSYDVISNYGAWMQFGFDYKVAQPLALYSVPSLQDPAYEHGKDVEVYRGGFRF